MYTHRFEQKRISATSCRSPDGTSMRLVYYRAQDTSVFTLMSFVGLFEHFVRRIRVQTPRNASRMRRLVLFAPAVCPSPLSSRLPARLFLSLSRICHFKPIRIIWDEASYSFRSSSASIFTQISLFSSKSNNADTVYPLYTCSGCINVCLDTLCMLPVEFVHGN